MNIEFVLYSNIFDISIKYKEIAVIFKLHVNQSHHWNVYSNTMRNMFSEHKVL